MESGNLSTKPKSVKEYLSELKETRKGKPAQVKQALEIYVDLWEKVIAKGVVSGDDSVEDALSKIDKAGGLYQAAED